MKEITYYKCEVCGTNYQTPEEAQECEDSHPKIKKVEYKYGQSFTSTNTYPHGIIVDFEDGVQIHYRECG